MPRSIRWTTSPPPRSTTRSPSRRCPTASCASACTWRRRASWSRATASSTSWRARAVHGLHAGRQDPHAARQRHQRLLAGRRTRVPALSLYVTADPETGEVLESETRLERVMVRENLRHNMLDAQVTEASRPIPPPNCLMAMAAPALEAGAGAVGSARTCAASPKTTRASNTASTGRQPRRPGHPGAAGAAPAQRAAGPHGGRVHDLANNLWGGLLHQHGVPGIYRSQQAGRVRMSTQALPHEAIGVPQYAWSTSPLRRYVDWSTSGS